MFPILASVLIFGSFLEVISGKDPRKCLSAILDFLPMVWILRDIGKSNSDLAVLPWDVPWGSIMGL